MTVVVPSIEALSSIHCINRLKSSLREAILGVDLTGFPVGTGSTWST